MSEESSWQSIGRRVAGKWQIPLAVVSFVLLGAAVWRIRPSPTALPLHRAFTHIDTMIAGRQFNEAVDVVHALLARENISENDMAQLYLRLGRAASGLSRRDRLFNALIGNQIIGHYRYAATRGVALSGEDFVNLGLASEWKKDYSSAVHYLKRAEKQPLDQKAEVQWYRITLEDRYLDPTNEQLKRDLDTFISEVPAHRLDLQIKALALQLYVLDELDLLSEASTLLVKHKSQFDQSDFKHAFAYLESWLLYSQGLEDEAETYLRTIRNDLEQDDLTYAKTGWLLGQVVMGVKTPKRPMEALSFFEDVLAHHATSAYAVASRVGMARAYAMLERHEDAISTYRIAIESMDELLPTRVVNRDVVRTSLGVLAETQRIAGHIAAATEYAQLAVSLLDRSDEDTASMMLTQLVHLQSMQAEALDAALMDDANARRGGMDYIEVSPSSEARVMFGLAGDTYYELARLHTLSEQRAAEAAWSAAHHYARGGFRERAIEVYRTFTIERPEHPLVPRALLRIGQQYQSLGLWAQSIESFQTCYRKFPRTLDAARALVPLAQCYLNEKPGQEELAEKALRLVLEDSEVFTPEAPEFRSAMFLLGDVLNRRESFEEAISTLEEALNRYDVDAATSRARFLLADSYRRSALALREEAAEVTFAGELLQIRSEAGDRLGRAATLYRQLIDEFENRDPTTLTPIEKLYLRHAYLYEADCYFETLDYQAALKLYEDAAGSFQDTTSSLAAYVQIINCDVFLGRPNEARAALARALILVDAMPQSSFDESLSPEKRADWRRYFQWLGESELF